VTKDRAGKSTGKVVVDVPLTKLASAGQLKSGGTVRAIESARDAKAPSGPLAHARIDVTYATADSIVGNDSGLWGRFRNGLGTSVTGLLWSLQLVVIGLCLIGPWVAAAWVIWRLWRRGRRASGRVGATPASASSIL